MKGYSYKIKENPENHAMARIEGVDASFKDLAEVCGRMRGLEATRALDLLEKFSTKELPVLYKSHNKRLGHRKELKGQKGRYPEKAAKIVLNALRSAIGNATIKGLIEPYVIVHISANKKRTIPRIRPKGRWGRSDYETARVEVVIREKEIVKKEKPKKKEVKKEEVQEPKTQTKQDTKKVEKKETKTEVKPIEKREKPKEVKKPQEKAKTEARKTEKKTETKEKKVDTKSDVKKVGEK